MSDLLLELFSEEIPARMQGKAAEDLRRLVTDGLVERGLTYGHAAGFATPRRLTLEQAIAYIQDDELVEVTPKSIRLRKRFLDPHERKRASRKAEAA